MTSVHIYRADKIKQIRVKCPYCEHLCYGTRYDFYDGSFTFLDCGTKINTDGWAPPPKEKCRYCRKYFEPLNMIKHLKEYHRIGGYNEQVN